MNQERTAGTLAPAARRFNWWAYHDGRMISYTPYYIILGEFGIAILLALLAK